jgi:hypothetical protein
MRVVFSGLLFAGFTWLTTQTANAVQFQITDPVEFNKIINTNAVFTTNATVNAGLRARCGFRPAIALCSVTAIITN